MTNVFFTERRLKIVLQLHSSFFIFYISNKIEFFMDVCEWVMHSRISVGPNQRDFYYKGICSNKNLSKNVFRHQSYKIKKQLSNNIYYRTCCLFDFPTCSSDLISAPAEDGSPAAFAAPLAETWPLLAVQRCGPDAAHVCVCSAGSLDGLCLVRHRTQGDREQRPRDLGHRWEQCVS